jgi:hypothetical protein
VTNRGAWVLDWGVAKHYPDMGLLFFESLGVKNKF